MVDITFRMAKFEDADLLLYWRNDKMAVRNSITKLEVDKESHIKWLKGIIDNEDHILLIAEYEGKPVGAFRMDALYDPDIGKSPDLRMISYSVAPEHRRKGFGRSIVAEGCARWGDEYAMMAKIRVENIASKKILESCDFTPMGELDRGIMTYLRVNDKDQTIQ